MRVYMLFVIWYVVDVGDCNDVVDVVDVVWRLCCWIFDVGGIGIFGR